MSGSVFPPSGPTTLTKILKAYVYQQYADDQDIQAFNTAFNELAQAYLTWFVDAGLPIYTGLTGPLLDWVAQGLYGILRPTLAYGSITGIGPLNTWELNTQELNSSLTTGSIQTFTVNDDYFRRIITWYFFKGDGFGFSIEWLKRRLMRFLIGVDGLAPNIDNTYPISITFTGANNVSITITASNTGGFPLADAQFLQEAISAGALPLPFQFNFSALLVDNITTTTQLLANIGGVINLIGGAGDYPTSSAGLPAGAVWDEDGLIYVIPGVDPSPNAPALFYGSISSGQLLALGGGNLPTIDPAVSGQLWNNGGFVCVSTGIIAPPVSPPVSPPISPPPGPPVPPSPPGPPISPPVTPGVELVTITFSDGSPSLTIPKNSGVLPIITYQQDAAIISIATSDGRIIGTFSLPAGVTLGETVTVYSQQTTVSFSDGSAPVIQVTKGGSTASIAINNNPVPPTVPGPAWNFTLAANFWSWAGVGIGQIQGVFVPIARPSLDFSQPPNTQYLL